MDHTIACNDITCNNANKTLIAICGREGAGKTTISNHLLKRADKTFNYIDIDHVDYYVLAILFGWNYIDLCGNFDLPADPIWQLTPKQALEKITKLFQAHIDSNFKFPNRAYIPFELFMFPIEETYQENAFAKPLKKIGAVLFEFPDIEQHKLYEILLGDTEEQRNLREKCQTVKYDVCGSLSGRKCLEYLGTEVFRNNFEQDFWIKIFQRNVSDILDSGGKIVVPDMRFKNEADAIEKMGGTIMVVYRDIKDLVLTEEDMKTHPAKWKFLEFLPDMKKVHKIHNNGTVKELQQKIDAIVHK